MKPSLKTKTGIRVGRISYINSIPFYHRLTSEPAAEGGSQIEFYEGYPTQVNSAMRRGEIDIAPISSLEYIHHQKDYLLLPDLAIGARDFSGSVLLLSKEKIDGLNKEKIALSKQSLSSATLLRILFKFKYKFKNEFISEEGKPQEMLARYNAALVIGDEALLYKSEEFVYKYDLSELWWNWTGKPFCFAVWAVSRDFAAKHPAELKAFYRKLKKNLEANLGDIEGLLKDSMNLTFLDERFPKLFGYLFNLNYGLDLSMREGLELFARLAQRLKVSPRPAKLEFAKVE
ncbi:MAG: menaquinone biosynthesis protein [Candidatus Omnitrophica bacterium]|nr:menaquinone biosynthesis protein [Candidatus Omnitrophota bacterium]